MNSNSFPLSNGDKNVLPQGVGVSSRQLTLGPAPVPKQKPTISQLRNAMDAFNIRGTARALAFELLSYWAPGGTVFPSVATLAAGLGLKPRMVQYHMKRLERIGLWSRHGRTGTTNIYELRLPGPVAKVDTTRVGGAMGCMGGCNGLHPEVTTEVVQPPTPYIPPSEPLPDHLTTSGRFVKCRRCQHDWPMAAGLSHRCIVRPDRPKRMARTKLPARPNPAWTSDRSRSEAINAARLARIRRECADHAPA